MANFIVDLSWFTEHDSMVMFHTDVYQREIHITNKKKDLK